MILGIGEDGHIASLFPRHPLLDEEQRLCAAIVDAPKHPHCRIIVMPSVIRGAKTTFVLAIGTAKTQIVRQAQVNCSDIRALPARLVSDAV